MRSTFRCYPALFVLCATLPALTPAVSHAQALPSAAVTPDITLDDTRETEEKHTSDSYFAAFALTVGLSLANAADGTGTSGSADFTSNGRGSVTVTATSAGKHRPFGGQNFGSTAADVFTGVPSATAVIPANPEPGEWMVLGMISTSIGGLMLRARLRMAARSRAVSAA
jgi:hypothetical protein